MDNNDILLGEILCNLGISGLAGNINEEEFKKQLIDEITNGLFGTWNKPWKNGYFLNFYYLFKNKQIVNECNIYGGNYHNLWNVFVLSNAIGIPVFITIEQVAKKGGKIVNKNNIQFIVKKFPLFNEVEDEDGNIQKEIKTFRGAWLRVTPISNVEGIDFPQINKIEVEKAELIEYIENILNATKDRIAPIFFDSSDKNIYYPLQDEIHLTSPESYQGRINEYYSTRFHESIHSTLAKKRCDRVIESHNWGDSGYALEELVAEIGSMLMCAKLGLEFSGKNARENSKAYLGGWLKKAKTLFKDNEEETLLKAFSYASQAVNYWLKDINLNDYIPQSIIDRIGKPDGEPMFENSECKIYIDNKEDKICIVFNNPIKEDLSQILKDNKFGYSGTDREWRGKNSAVTLEKILSTIKKYYTDIDNIPKTKIDKLIRDSFYEYDIPQKYKLVDGDKGAKEQRKIFKLLSFWENEIKDFQLLYTRKDIECYYKLGHILKIVDYFFDIEPNLEHQYFFEPFEIIAIAFSISNGDIIEYIINKYVEHFVERMGLSTRKIRSDASYERKKRLYIDFNIKTIDYLEFEKYFTNKIIKKYGWLYVAVTNECYLKLK